MSKKLTFINILLIISLSQIVTAENPKVLLNVEVLYETLCPDSLNFITQQLHPVWDEISPYVNLKLVPFGKSASSDNGSHFVCQHGPQECKGNRIQSCALASLNTNENAATRPSVNYVNCFMKVFMKDRRNPNQFGQSCAAEVGLDFSKVMQCFESAAGAQLQLIAEQATAKYQPAFVPSIIFNGVFNQELQDASLTDFRRVVCDFVTKLYPEACKQRTVLRL